MQIQSKRLWDKCSYAKYFPVDNMTLDNRLD